MTKDARTKHLIIYVDDDPDDLSFVQEAFERYSHIIKMITFNNGMKALDYLDSLSEYHQVPCLIILDINMPGIGGKDLLKTLRRMEQFKDVPVIIFSTSNLPSDASFATYYNAGFMTKPLDYGQMEIITEKFIDHCTEEVQNRIRKSSH